MSEKEKQELKMVSEFIGNLANVIPSIVKGVIQGLFSEETGISMGKAVGNFYKGLRDAGIPEDKAVAMADSYLGTLTKWSEALKELQSIQGIQFGPKGGPKGGPKVEVGGKVSEEIQKQVKEQIEKALKKKPEDTEKPET